MRRGVVIAVALSVLVASAVSLAAGFSPHSGSSVSSSSVDDRIEINGSADDNDIDVSHLGGSRYRIEDRTGVTRLSGCEQVDPETVDCTNDSLHPSIVYSAYGGNDGVDFSVSVPATITAEAGGSGSFGPRGDQRFEIAAGSPARARFSGHIGADTLIGGSDYDFLSGGRGADRMIGRAGADRLLGAQQADTFIGGSGDDRIEAARNDRDRAIRCGPGDDVAIIDRDEDPKPTDCETVKVR